MLRSTKLVKSRALSDVPCFEAWVTRFLYLLGSALFCPVSISCRATVGVLDCMAFLPHCVQNGVVTVIPHCPQIEDF